MLKLIAILSMIVDHVGYVFFPEQEWMRILGRIAFPVFAYQIAQGILHTSDIKKYVSRLFMFGAISIVPYYLVFDTFTPNIILTFALTVWVVYLWERKEEKWLAIALLFAMYFLNIEYGIYAVIAIILFKERMYLLFIPLTIGKALIEEWYIQIAAIAALPLIYASDWLDRNIKININKWFFYWFYPVHLLMLYIIDILIN